MKTLKEFLEAFQNENYKISIVNGNRVSSDEDYVLITTDKKYKDCIKDKILNLTVSGFAINDYDERLVIEVGRNYNERTLRRIRQFYLVFKDEIWSTMSTKLMWSHYTEILSLSNINEINYSINITEEYNLSVRELRERLKTKNIKYY